MKPLARTLALLVTLTLALTGCTALAGGRADHQARFDDLARRQFVDMVTTDSLHLHWFLRHPADMGIDPPDTSLATADFPSDEVIERWYGRLAELRSIDRGLLTAAQQADYDVLTFQLEMLEPSLRFHYHNTRLLGDEQTHVLVPLMLGEYSFDDLAAVDRYLVLLSQVGEVFDSLIRHQESRAGLGLHLTDRQLDQVIEECGGFLEMTPENVLMASFAHRLGSLGLDDSLAQSYLARNEDILTGTVVPAYERLVAGLDRLREAGLTTPDVVVTEESRAFYAYALTGLGLDRTPEELIAIADEAVDTLAREWEEVRALVEDNRDAVGRMALFGDPMTGQEVYDFWASRAAADFPAPPESITVDIQPIPESLKDIFAAAYYLVPRIDDPRLNQIRYHPDQATDDPDALGLVMAHEGVPGHLLQGAWLRSGPLSPYRQAFSITAHTEGWAQYAETYSYRYLDAHDLLIRLAEANSRLQYMGLLRLDLGIHYEGWTAADVTGFVTARVPLWGDSAEFHERLVHFVTVSPLMAVPYAMGHYEMERLRDRYQSSLGPDYTDRAFHEDFLNLGPAPFHLIERWLDEALLGA